MIDCGSELRSPDRRAPGTAATGALAWRFQILAEIANFGALRRTIGLAHAGRLASDVADRIGAIDPAIRAEAIGRSLVLIEFYGGHADVLDETLGTIRDACAAPFDLAGGSHAIAMIYGAAFAPAHRADEVRLAEDAEAALAEARAVEQGGAEDVPDPARSEARLLAAELEIALTRDELVIHYQPKIHVRRQEIGSAEALVRWRHPRRGMILPGEFIPVAEQFQVIDRLTLWTIRRAIDDQRTLAARGRDLRLFINISGQLLADADFVDAACRLVAETEAKLGFEVTETSVIRDPTSAITNIQRFADSGVVIAIDDYGSGLSSLAYLKQLPARELKIDKLFVTQLTSSNRDPLIVRSTIDLAHAMEMEVVAEGVETHASLALLTVMGCDMVQGYLISRPIALDALMAFLDEDHHQFAPHDSRAAFTGLAAAWRRA